MLLSILIGMAIMIIVYAMYLEALNPFAAFRVGEADDYSDPNAYPWQEQHMFFGKMGDVYGMGDKRSPFKYQPRITETFVYTADVYNGSEPRGYVTLRIRTDGEASARWTADCEINGKYYETFAEKYMEILGQKVKPNFFKGNIAPLKIYEDENGPDKSKLYVITKGFFYLERSIGGEAISGSAYITAWIDKQYNAKGTLAIPSFFDRKIAVFNWGPVELDNPQ